MYVNMCIRICMYVYEIIKLHQCLWSHVIMPHPAQVFFRNFIFQRFGYIFFWNILKSLWNKNFKTICDWSFLQNTGDILHVVHMYVCLYRNLLTHPSSVCQYNFRFSIFFFSICNHQRLTKFGKLLLSHTHSYFLHQYVQLSRLVNTEKQRKQK